jgi:hypothetical protein
MLYILWQMYQVAAIDETATVESITNKSLIESSNVERVSGHSFGTGSLSSSNLQESVVGQDESMLIYREQKSQEVSSEVQRNSTKSQP